jgi:phage-related protein
MHGEVKSPPFSAKARLEAGALLRQLQRGQVLAHSRPVPAIGPHCHELRIQDANAIWRIVYRLDADAVIIIEVFSKKTPTTPRGVLDVCRRRLRAYDQATRRERGQ